MSDLNNHPLIKAYIDGNNFGRTLGMNFNVLEQGRIEYTIEIGSQHLATPRAAHGGVIAAFTDALLGVAALSQVCELDKVVATVEFKLSFVNPVMLGDRLTGKADVIKAGNRLIFVEGRIYNQNNDLISTSSGTFNAYPKAKAGY